MKPLPRAWLAKDGIGKRIQGLAYAEKWLVAGAVIGAASGLFIIAFFQLLTIIVNVSSRLLGVKGVEAADISLAAVEAANKAYLALLIIFGAAVSSLIVYRIAPEAEGHGTDAAIAAFHKRAAIIPFRVPIVKLIASGIAIGTGSSGGVEGPSVQMGAGVGSTIARLVRAPLQDRRIALVAGIAGALSAMFRAPLGSAFFATEVLYKKDLEAQALMPAMVSSLVSYAITAPYFHYAELLPKISLDPRSLYSPLSIASLLVLGIYVAPFAYIYAHVFNKAKIAFETIRLKYNLPMEAKPILGSVGAAIIAMVVPHVAGSGKGLLRLVVSGEIVETLPLNGVLPLALALVVLALAKIAATSLSIGSGASGGVFAPALLAGSSLGLSFYYLIEGHGPQLPVGVYAYVGMAAFFGAAAKVPLATSIMVGEMSGNYLLIAPTLAAAYIARELTGQVSLYESQIMERPPREVITAEGLLAMIKEKGEKVDITLGELADESLHPVKTRDPLAKALEMLMSSHGLPVPVVDDHWRLVGVIDPEDAERLVEYVGGELETPLESVPLRRPPALPYYETVERGLEEMVEHETDYVMVVDDDERYIGIVTLEEVEVALAFIVAGVFHGRPL